MGKVHLVIPDPHSHPQHNNDRAIWVGKLINELKPDVVINLGDTADLPSLCSYDKGKKSFQGRTYAADIAAHGDFQSKLWDMVRSAKKRMPRRVTLIGNHEERIGRAIDMQPELEGVISYDDLELERWYDDVVPYIGGTPGNIVIDGIMYAHYAITGVSGRPISGEHTAYSLLAKQYHSTVVGHLHTFDYCIRTRADGRKIMGLCAGVYQDYHAGWAGEANNLWWRGVCILRGVQDGCYDLETIGMQRLRKEYK